MADIVIGMDIGESAIKAVQVVKSFQGGSHVTASAVVPIDDDKNIEAALAKLLANEAFQQGRYILNYPADRVTFRQVRMPFSDKKKIDQTLTFNLEPKLPFPIDDVLVEYLVTPSGRQGDILAAVAEKADIIGRINLLESFDKKVDIVDIDAFPVVSCLLARESCARTGILLDMGDKTITAIFFSAGSILQVRCYGKGRNAGGEDNDWPVRFIAAFHHTVEFLKWHVEDLPDFSEVFITGGGALDKHFQRLLADGLDVAVTPLDVAAEAAVKIDDTVLPHWQPLLMNQALALALRPRAKDRTGFNFRAKIGKDKVKYTWLLKNLKWTGAVAAAILVLGFAELYLDYALTSARVLRLKSEVKAIVKQSAPEIKEIVDPLQQLKAKITESRKISQSLREISTGTTFLDVLLDISSLVPPSTSFILQSLTYNHDKIVLRGEAQTFDAVDIIKKELSRSRMLSAVTISSSNAAKQGGKVDFEMHMAVKNQR